MTSSLGFSLCAGVVRGQVSSRSDKMHKVACSVKSFGLKGVAHMRGVPGWLPGGGWKTAGALLLLEALALSRFVQQHRALSEPSLDLGQSCSCSRET